MPITVNRQRGFSLIEVLVAVLILAIGLLGVASMQLTSLKVNQGAYYRSQASILANDILDRMRANREAYLNGAYDGADTSGTVPSAQACVTQADGCSGANIASQDIRDWAAYFTDVNNVGATFTPIIPNGVGTVTRDAGNNNATVTITWDQENWSGSQKAINQTQIQMVVRI